jgi:S1-C subfamily serine protease
MRKGWLILIVVVVVALAVPAVAIHSGGGGWLKEKLLALHGKHGAIRHGTPDRASSGLRIEAVAADKTFRIIEVLDGSPAFDAGLRPGDVITAVDGRAASELTLSEVMDALGRPVSRKLTIIRAQETLTVILR